MHSEHYRRSLYGFKRPYSVKGPKLIACGWVARASRGKCSRKFFAADRNAWANNSVGRSVGVRNPVEVPFNTENEIAELIVESELASSDECPVVVYAVAQAQAEETVGHVTSAPGFTDVGAEVESSPTKRRSQIDWRRCIDRRARANFSGIRSHRKCQQRRCRGGRMEQDRLKKKIWHMRRVVISCPDTDAAALAAAVVVRKFTTPQSRCSHMKSRKPWRC